MTVTSPSADPRVRFGDGLTELMAPIESVRAADRNPNTGDVEAIAESIVINGYQVPVIARRDTGEIVAGNHRYYAMLSLGAAQIPVIWTDMDDQQAMRFLIADNRMARLGRDDPNQLLELLDEIQGTSPIGLAGTGFDPADLDALTELTGGPLDLDDEPDDFEDTGYARQRAKTITCPACGTEFGGGR